MSTFSYRFQMSRLVIAHEGDQMVLKVVEDVSVAEDREEACPCGSGCAQRCFQKEYKELLQFLGLDDEPYPEDLPDSTIRATPAQELAKSSVGEVSERSSNGSESQTEESHSSSSRSESFIGMSGRKRSRAECKNEYYGDNSATKRPRSTRQARSAGKARKNSLTK